MIKIVIIGGGGHAKVVISIINKNSNFDIIGYTDNENKRNILGVSYLGNDQVLEKIIQDVPNCAAVIGIGNIEITEKRIVIFKKLRERGFALPPIISPHAIVNEDVIVQDATVVIDGVVINTGSKIGSASIINTKSSIGHGCDIGDFVHIASGVTIGGGVKIGTNSFIGIGASIIQNIVICENCLIGAGSVVVKDIRESGTYIGIPARRIN